MLITATWNGRRLLDPEPWAGELHVDAQLVTAAEEALRAATPR